MYSGHYEAGENIDFLGASFWGVGSYETPFTGHFNGKGYTIGNFYQYGGESWDYAGLFRVIWNATITNVRISDVVIEGNTYVGGLAGYAYGSQTCIENCDVLEATVRGKVFAGGLVDKLEEIYGGNEKVFVIFKVEGQNFDASTRSNWSGTYSATPLMRFLYRMGQ